MPVTCAMESGPSAAITSAKRSPELRFHDDPVPAVLGHDVVDRDGSLVVDRGGGAGLDQDTTGSTRIGAVGRRVAHDVLLKGDGPVQQFILGQPHPAHPAASQERS
jgi:hypothetical protein